MADERREELEERIARFEGYRAENLEHYEALQELAREYAEDGNTEGEATVREVMGGYAIATREYAKVVENLKRQLEELG